MVVWCWLLSLYTSLKFGALTRYHRLVNDAQYAKAQGVNENAVVDPLNLQRQRLEFPDSGLISAGEGIPNRMLFVKNFVYEFTIK